MVKDGMLLKIGKILGRWYITENWEDIGRDMARLKIKFSISLIMVS